MFTTDTFQIVTTFIIIITYTKKLSFGLFYALMDTFDLAQNYDKNQWVTPK